MREPGVYLKSYGATQKVPGSADMFVLINEDQSIQKVLWEFGDHFDGRRKDIHDPHRADLDFTLDNVVAVGAGHGHTDHIGFFPFLPQNGYNGRYYGHKATGDILKVELEDYLSRERYMINKYNRTIRNKTDENGDSIPLMQSQFTKEHIRKIMNHYHGMLYGVPTILDPKTRNIQLTLQDAGHIIGSAMADIKFKAEGKEISLVIACDVGKMGVDVPVLNDPYTGFKGTRPDYVMVEATYGPAKHHGGNPKEELWAIVEEAISEEKRIWLPSFAKGRLQNNCTYIYEGKREGVIPKDFWLCIDSVSGYKFNLLTAKHPECFDKGFLEYTRDRKDTPFKGEFIEVIRTKKRSLELNDIHYPYILSSTSGMCDMGRSVNHIESFVEDPNSIIAICGWQRPGSVGHQIENQNEIIKFNGNEYTLQADVRRIHDGAHASGDDLVKFVCEMDPQKGILIKHGGKKQCAWTETEFEKAKQRGEISPEVQIEVIKEDRYYKLGADGLEIFED